MPPDLKLPPLPDGADGQVWVAYSGGRDSTALLHRLAAEYAVRAVHVHHGLQPAADDWLRHCRRVCRRLGVPLRVLRVEVSVSDGLGIEAAARRARYRALERLLRAGDVMATAHHRDDQAETVLLRALRGSGVVGLAGMRRERPLGRGVLWRPLLSTPRARVEAYLRGQGLGRQEGGWIDDPHNADPRLARAFLRTEIMPRLAGMFPQATGSLVRLAQRAAAADELLSELAQQDRSAAAHADGGLSVKALLALSPERRHNLIYFEWRALGFEAPAEAWFARLDREVLRARRDAVPVLGAGGAEARRYRDRLFLMPALPPAPGGVVITWGEGARQRLPEGCGELRRRGPGTAALEIRFARGGERLRPDGGRHTRTLKQLCQEAGIPPWVRERMPLVYRGETLLAVAGYWRSAAAAASGLRFEWCRAPMGAPRGIPD
ncbi:MAG: tRNA lysidine(34) synthetase TilS [Nevskiales bacterium]|nr:tRNA lysidine(34) synthetase TilS [Nevskiales bacterium]